MAENAYRVVMQADTPTQIVWVAKPTPQEREEFFAGWAGWTFDPSKPLDKTKTTYALTTVHAVPSVPNRKTQTQTEGPQMADTETAEKKTAPKTAPKTEKKAPPKKAAKNAAKKAPKTAPKRKVARGKDRKPRVGAAALFRELVMAGRLTDEAILKQVTAKFPGTPQKLQRVAWARWELKTRLGQNPPLRKFAK